METYHKIQTLFKRDLDGSITGQKGKMIKGKWTTQELEYLADLQWEFTEKVDGTNIRIGCGFDSSVQFAGRSDNASLPELLRRHLESTFTSELFVDAGLGNDKGMVTLFGEGYGGKIQNGGNYRADQSFVLFDVKIGNFWLDRANVNDIAEKLGIESVPTLGYGTLHDAIEIVSSGITFTKFGAVKYWGRGGLRSTWGEFEAEGIVARPVVPLFNRKGERIITKIKAIDFR